MAILKGLIAVLRKEGVPSNTLPMRPVFSQSEARALVERPYLATVKRGVEILPYVNQVPGGRRMTATAMIAALTGNGEELIVNALLCMRGELRAYGVSAFGEPVEHTPSIKDIQQAREFLANRLWGKAVETVQLEDKREIEVVDVTSLPLEDFKGFFRALTKLERGTESAIVEQEDSIKSDPAEDAGNIEPGPEGSPESA